MRTHTLRWQGIVAIIFIVLITAGCYQSAGGGASQPTPISQALPSATPTSTDTPFPTDIPTEFPTELPTDDTGIGGNVGQSVFDTPTTESNVVAQEPTLDPLFGSATAIVQGATQTVEAMLTGTSFSFPTNTPIVFATQPGATPLPLVPGADCIHEVRAEDRNLYRISLLYGVPVADIAAASGITNINLIRIGQRLTIPHCGTTGVTPPPTSTEPVTATPFGTPAAAGGVPPTAQAVTGGRVHVVAQGETLYEISVQYGVPVADIAAANGITNINLIYLGQELVIP